MKTQNLTAYTSSLLLIASTPITAFAWSIPAESLNQRISELNVSKEQKALIEGIVVDSQIKVLLQQKETNKIWGGEMVAQSSYPWMAALLTEDTHGNRYLFCGGTLISKNKILTAAHCNTYPQGYVKVLLGGVDINSPEAELIPIKSFKTHPQYTSAEKGYDVAVITLARDSKSPTTISLADKNPEINDNTINMLKIMGWGITENGLPSEKLLEAQVPLISKEKCLIPYPDIKDDMLCGGFTDGRIDTCQGDSGGPALLIGKNKVLTQIGITSWGHGCALAGFYGVYSRIPTHLPWIKEQL